MFNEKTTEALANAIAEQVTEEIMNDPEFFDFMVEAIHRGLDGVLGKIDDDLLCELAVLVGERIVLKAV